MYVNKKIQRLKWRIFLDTIAFPIRALLMPTVGRFGLSSLRDERMRIVASFCKGRVLDVGCGPGNVFINEFIGKNNGIGIDIYQYDGVETIVERMTDLPFNDCSFDSITLIAVGGHIPKSIRKDEFREFSRVLKHGGMLIITEGEPITQYLCHKWMPFYFALQGKKDMDTERGMEDDEEFCMPGDEIISYLSTPPLTFFKRKRFMWGLNNVYIAKKL